MASKIEPSGDKKRQRRKKKNSRFMRNAKGFAKQGIYGRGTHIDDDQYRYYINILDAMKNGFEDADEKVTMANNVFGQTQEQEIYLSSNQIVCKVLETLIGFVDAVNFERFCNVFADNLRPVCSDRFASHVLQKMVEVAFLRSVGKQNLKIDVDTPEEAATAAKRAKVDLLCEEHYNLETDFSEEHREYCRNFVARVGKFLLNNLEDFVWDSCANHIMRTSILCLAGVHVPKVAFEKGSAEMAKNRKLYVAPEPWLEVMKEFPQRLEMWPHFSDFPYQEHSAALLGVICIALKVVDKNLLKHLGKKILTEALLKVDVDDEKGDKVEISDNEPKDVIDIDNGEDAAKDANADTTALSQAAIKLPKVFHYQCSVILLETLLSVAKRKLFTQLYAMLFTGRIAELAQQQLTNFAVQKLLLHIPEKTDFEEIFGELVDHTEQLLKIGHTGVVEALVAGCLRLGTKQAQMIVALQKALHVAADKEKCKLFLRCLLKLKPYAVTLEDNSAFVHLHGSLIVQHILHFNKPILLVNCILETSPDQLVAVFNTPNGSHILDAFMKSKFIGEKSREKLIRHLEGFYVDLAITKFGSRITESCFTAAQESQKMHIAKELAEKANMLKGSPFGRLLYNKFRLETYRLSATQWKNSLQHKEQSAAQRFENIIN